MLSVSIIKVFIKSCSIDSRNEQNPTCEVVHETKLTSEISFPTDSLLAQLAEPGTDDLEVVGSIPGRDNFFLFCSSPSMQAGFCHNLAGNDELCKNSNFPSTVLLPRWRINFTRTRDFSLFVSILH